MATLHLVAGFTAVALALYLCAALLWPEQF
ncbi:K(+)-transporting ATPase subunit F [Plasticicumulans acidivorans]|uniref:K+-transporting ATPase KdpF subunit n=1 Tax=Plasticicumulans acidivorans TaxID=886464 RepID=A0A317MT43_9GAMM|nr:K(+)-transporting ATPase subunit F [Plasticicumulans acidivorans]PWV59869.1 K+-transporting ATPase KdpF subunit [Plasticicumulans acidivorans]